MATYDFINHETGVVRTIKQSIHEPTPAQIADEQGTVYKRLFSAPAVVYACAGFYTTDNADSITKWQRENLKDM